MKENLSNLSGPELIRCWKAGELAAAEVIVERYAIRLIALVDSRMNRELQPKMAAEDVVQSAMGSFFAAIDQDRIRASQILSVWGLLATIAKRKMFRALEWHSATKRGGGAIQIPLERDLVQWTLAPTTSDVDSLINELIGLGGDSSPVIRSILEGIVAGKTQKEIAAELAISDRTVRRTFQRLRKAAAMHVKPCKRHEATFIPKSLERWQYGEFVLGRMVGYGTFGKVYRAVMQSTTTIDSHKAEKFVAVKFLRKQFWQHGEAKQLFLKEVDFASRIEHPSVVQHLGWGESPGGGPFIVQQWIEGGPLTEKRSATPEQFVSWLVQICDALEAIHAKKIVHGDLTPNNVLIGEDGRARLTDFGFAQSIASTRKETGSSFESTIHGGTLGFAAPEQISNAFGAIGPHTDTFAIGGLAYWFLTGCAPFSRTNQATSSIEQTLSTKPILSINNKDKALSAIASRCLNKVIAQRPKSVCEVRRWLTESSLGD